MVEESIVNMQASHNNGIDYKDLDKSTLISSVNPSRVLTAYQ